MTNAEQERDRLRSLYAGMGDGELEKLATEAAELTDLAREVLAEEIRNRGLAVEQPQPVAPGESDEVRVVPRNGLVTIRQFRDLHDALLAQGVIQSAGIQERIQQLRFSLHEESICGALDEIESLLDTDCADVLPSCSDCAHHGARFTAL